MPDDGPPEDDDPECGRRFSLRRRISPALGLTLTTDVDRSAPLHHACGKKRLGATILMMRGLSVFLLEPQGPPSAFQPHATRVPTLDRGREPRDYRVWFVTHGDRRIAAGCRRPSTTTTSFFCFVTDDIGLGNVPTIIFDPRDPGAELRYYFKGLDEPESVETCRLPIRRSRWTTFSSDPAHLPEPARYSRSTGVVQSCGPTPVTG